MQPTEMQLHIGLPVMKLARGPQIRNCALKSGTSFPQVLQLYLCQRCDIADS